jgi:hypothetical protein
METISYASLVSKLEQLVAAAVFGSYPSNWNEEAITRLLLKSIKKNLDNLTIVGFKRTFAITWDAYKNRQAEAAPLGDVAVLVKIVHKDDLVIEGAATIETKKRTNKKLTFDELRWNDIGKLSRNAPGPQLMLYDYEDISSFSSNIVMKVQSSRPSYWREQMMVTPYTYAVLTPMNAALNLKRNDTSLYDFSLPFASQLVFRYFHGLDLDFSAKATKYATGVESRFGFARNLLCLYVSEVGTDLMTKAELNRDVWMALD